MSMSMQNQRYFRKVLYHYERIFFDNIQAHFLRVTFYFDNAGMIRDVTKNERLKIEEKFSL